MGQKVTFNPITKIIQVDVAPVGGIVDLDIKVDVYSDGKEDWRASASLFKYRFPLRAVGGDLTPTGALGSTFFLDPGWKIRPYEADHRFAVSGNFFSEDGTSPFTTTIGNYNVFLEQALSNLVDQVSTGSGLDAGQDAMLTAIHDYSSHIPYLEHSVWVDTELALNGNGSQHSPFNNVTDAIDFAEANNVKQLLVTSDLTIDRQIKNFVIRGIGTPIIDCNGQNLDGSEISHCTVTGLYTGNLIVQESNMIGTFVLNGFFENCAISTASLVLLDGGVAYIKDCSAFVEGQVVPTFDIAGVLGTATLIMTGYDGGLKILNVSQPTDDVKILLGTGRVVLDNSCVDGNINVGGITHLVDNSLGSNVFSEVLDPHQLTDVYKSAFNKRVWNKLDTLTLYEDDKVTPLQIYDTDNEMSVIDPQ